MKRRLITAVLATTLAIASFGGIAFAEGAGQPNENASCVGNERATRNSAGGDREKGGFGPAQAAFVQSLNETGETNYGQFLQEWKAACEAAD